MIRYQAVSKAELTIFSSLDKEPLVTTMTKHEWVASQPARSKPASIWRKCLEIEAKPYPEPIPFAEIKAHNVIIMFKALPCECTHSKYMHPAGPCRFFRFPQNCHCIRYKTQSDVQDTPDQNT